MVRGATGILLTCLVLIGGYFEGAECGIAGLNTEPDAVFSTFNESDGMILCNAQNTTFILTDQLLANSPINPIGSFDFLDDVGSPIENCSFPGGSNKIILDEYFGQCASSVDESDTLLVVNYTLCVAPVDDPAAIISRDPSSLIFFTCTFVRDVTVSELRIDPSINRIQAVAPEVEGTFTVDMTRYTANDFSVVEQSQEIVVDEPVYIGLAVEGGASADLVLQAINCWATPTSNRSDSVRYDIIYDRCVANDDDWERNTVVKNFDGPVVEFIYDAFVWTVNLDELQEIYTHCEVSICPNAIAEFNCMADPCTTRKRRSMTKDLQREVISVGPVKVKSKQNGECNKKCSHGCRMDKYGKSYCYCPPSMELDAEGLDCLVNSEKHLKEQQPEVRYIVRQVRGNANTVLVAALLMFTFMLGMVWIQNNRRTKIGSTAAGNDIKL